jgi:hypothetical protein
MMKKKSIPTPPTNKLERKLNAYNISRENYEMHRDRLLGEGFSMENIQHLLLRKKGIERAKKLFESYRILLDQHFTHAQITEIFALSANMLTIQQCLDHTHEWLTKYSHLEIIRMTACTFCTGNIELLSQYQEQMENAGYSLRQIPEILSRSSGYHVIRAQLDVVNQEQTAPLQVINLNEIKDESLKTKNDNQIAPMSASAFGFFNTSAAAPELPVDEFDVNFAIFDSLDF